MKQTWLREALRLAERGVERNCGGPFGAVIVREGVIVGRGWNKVTSSNDPTAHAEVVAIRAACRKLGTFVLDDCVLYASCEPCPMCLAAAYWARIPEVVYGASQQDAAKAGFDDCVFYEELKLAPEKRRLRMVQMLRGEAQVPFDIWAKKRDKVPY